MTKLSPREQQIAGLVAAGHTDMQIAQKLGISYYTVRSYVSRIHAKMNTKGRRVNLAVGFAQCCALEF